MEPKRQGFGREPGQRRNGETALATIPDKPNINTLLSHMNLKKIQEFDLFFIPLCIILYGIILYGIIQNGIKQFFYEKLSFYLRNNGH